MTLQSAIHSLWLVELAFQGLLTVVLLGKRAWAPFPFFTALCVFDFVSGLWGYFTYGSPKLYFYTFVIGESIAVMLGLAVVYEVFARLFSVHSALRKLATSLFCLAIVALVGLGCLVVYLHAPDGPRSIGAAVLVAEESSRILEVGLLMFLFVFSGAFGLHWRQSVFGIALGLGIYTVVELIIATVWSQFGVGSSGVFSIVRLLASNVSLLVWIGYLVVPEPVTSGVEVPKRTQLEQWNQAIMELINQ